MRLSGHVVPWVQGPGRDRAAQLQLAAPHSSG
jgi:hypothetical protein